MSRVYEPTPDEIKAACEAIRATWSEAVRRQRAAWMYEQEEIVFDAIKLDKKLREIVEFAERFKGQGHQVGLTEQRKTPAG